MISVRSQLVRRVQQQTRANTWVAHLDRTRCAGPAVRQTSGPRPGQYEFRGLSATITAGSHQPPLVCRPSVRQPHGAPWPRTPFSAAAAPRMLRYVPERLQRRIARGRSPSLSVPVGNYSAPVNAQSPRSSNYHHPGLEIPLLAPVFQRKPPALGGEC